MHDDEEDEGEHGKVEFYLDDNDIYKKDDGSVKQLKVHADVNVDAMNEYLEQSELNETYKHDSRDTITDDSLHDTNDQSHEAKGEGK